MVHHMRSVRGLAAAIAALITYPAAIVAGMTIGPSAADTTVHFVLGTAFVLLAVAMADFGLARWVTWLGSAAAAVCGATFLLQGVADITSVGALDWLAFDVLGHQLERMLPDVVYVWFAALLLTGTAGWSRFAGWAIVPVLFGLEIAILIGAQIGVDVPFIKLTIFLPFIWLLIESIKSAAPSPSKQPIPASTLVEGAA